MTSSAGAQFVYTGVVCAAIGAVTISAKTILVKLAYEYAVDPITLVTLRMLFAFPFFLLMALWAGAVNLERRDWIGLIGLGSLSYYLGSLLDFTGLQYISAGMGRLVLYLYPTIVLVMSAAFLAQPIRGREVLSFVLSYGGIALAYWEEIEVNGEWDVTLLGTGLVFANAICAAIYFLGGGKYVRKLGSMRFTAYTSIAASVFVIVHFLAVKGPAGLVVDTPVYTYAAIMAIISTVLPLWLVAEAIGRIGPNQVALIGCIGPLSTMVLAYVVLGDSNSGVQWLAVTLILAGVLTITVKPRPFER